MRKERSQAALALALLVPVPTLGALAAFVLAPGPVGQAIYFAGKVWIAVLPLAWLVLGEKGRLSLSPLPREQRASALRAALALGIVLGAIVAGVYAQFGRELLDPDHLRETIVAAGFGTRPRYFALALYLVVANSLVEEFVWRWFVFRQCEKLLPSTTAVVVSALFFTLHHAVVFHFEFGSAAGALAAAGVFVAGLVWSWFYRRYRSIWPGYASHVIVDLVALAIGWRILFG